MLDVGHVNEDDNAVAHAHDHVDGAATCLMRTLMMMYDDAGSDPSTLAPWSAYCGDC